MDFTKWKEKGSLPQCLPILGAGSPGHAIGFSTEIKRPTSRGHKPSRLQDTWGCSWAKLHRQAVVSARNADLYKKSKEIWSFKNRISQFLNIGSIKNKIKHVFGLHLVASLSLWNTAWEWNTSFWSQKDLGSELSSTPYQLGDFGQVI